ncbi:MAG: S41 family peptidase [Candidatus Eisenbacteria bacterium]|uniref:S41 family peptidase n=1 Tax=Eiseniibacteriota bacterium TaxID=2212470 RepID=A0A933SE15_UNCEI|nr:S41 family peptidase [Candidatus Eisenbacteria bacterium]
MNAPLRRFGLLALTSLALGASSALAQTHGGGAAGPGDTVDHPLDAATRSAVVESLAVAVQRWYVFPDRGAGLAKDLRRRAAKREYDRITSQREFADSLRAHMQAYTHDGHMRVHYRAEPWPKQAENEGPPPPEERARQLAAERRQNFGFQRVERLPGNVGYLDLRSFSGLPEAHATAIAAMNVLANCDAVIVDVRRNGGGDPTLLQTVITYFVAPGDRLHVNDFYLREGDRTEQFWSAANVPGPRLNGKPLYVLTSPLTGSCAEEFAYDVQTHALGTLYGATTAGAANPGGLFPLSDHLAAFIATGRAINPVTHTNWEGVGVKPDHDVPPGDALREAHVAAITKLLETPADEDHRALLNRALERAKATVSDPAEDFVRGPRRR